jgi:hypothetical protein
MWILDSIKHYDERMLSALSGDYILEIVILFRGRHGDDALVRIVAGHVVEFLARHKAHGDALPPAFIDDMLQAKIVTLFCNSHPGESAASRLESLGYSIDPVNVIHALVV